MAGEAAQMAAWWEDAGLDAVEISGADPVRLHKAATEAYFAKNAKLIKASLRSMPLMLVGGLRTLARMKKLHEEFVDFVSLCRPLAREPDLVRKFRNGKATSDCLSCGRCRSQKGQVSCYHLRLK